MFLTHPTVGIPYYKANFCTGCSCSAVHTLLSLSWGASQTRVNLQWHVLTYDMLYLVVNKL